MPVQEISYISDVSVLFTPYTVQYIRSYSGDCKSMLNCIKSLHSILLLPEKTDSNNITCFYWQTKRIKIRLYL